MKLEVDRIELAKLRQELVDQIVEGLEQRLAAFRPLAERHGGLERVVGYDELAAHLGITRPAVIGRVKKGDLPEPRKIAGTMGWLASELNLHFRGEPRPPIQEPPTGGRPRPRAPRGPDRPSGTGRTVSSRRGPHD